MKYKLTLALVAATTSSAFAAFQAPLPEFKNEKQLAEWRAEKASDSTNQSYASEETAFYTGKPYLASSSGYAFKYRSYNPEVARWTSEDPSGFPDGANGNAYAPIPTSSLDFAGLWRVKLVSGGGYISAPHYEQTTAGGRLQVDASQGVYTHNFLIDCTVAVGNGAGLTSTSISGSAILTPGGDQIMLNLSAPSSSTSSGLANASVAIGNITYFDNNKTVSFSPFASG